MERTRKKIISVFVPHEGCPHDCFFCNQKKISGKARIPNEVEVRYIIDESLKTINNSTHNIEIAFYGGSFTGIDQESQKMYLQIAKEFKLSGRINQIRLSTRPDYIDENILQFLKSYLVDTIELGVQSFFDDVLIASNRGHSANESIKACKLIKNKGFKLGIQTMIGLPNDTFEKSVETAKIVTSLNPDCVRIYPTLVIKDTFLEQLLDRGEYKPFSLDDAIEICSSIIKIYRHNNINVIRVGLQATKEINLGKAIIEGPFHPAFGELVDSKIILDNIIEKINSILLHTHSPQKKLRLRIRVPNAFVSKVIGHKKNNLRYLKFMYNFDIIDVVVYTEDKDIEDIFVELI